MRSLLPLPLLVLAGACAAEPPLAPSAPPPAPLRAPDFGAVTPPPAPEPPAERHVVELRIAPVAAGRELDHLDVALRFSEPPGELGNPLRLWLTQVEGTETGWPEAIEEMYARDADGALPLRASPAAPAGAVPYVEWRSERRPVGAVSIGYRVRLAHVEGGRYQGTRASAGGFEGTGRTFLALPETAEPYRVRLSWDLAAAGEGATAVSSLGAGETSGPLSRLREAAFMAGPLGRLSFADGGARSEAAWLGHPAFDPLEALPWLLRAHAAARALLRGAPPPAERAPFTALARVVPGAGLSTAPLPGGLLLLPGDALGWTRATRFAAARALVAQAGARFAGPEPAAARLGEALAGHLAREALLGAGLATLDEVADDLREHLEASDPGTLYAADVDAAARARPGSRSLADLARPLLEKARASGELPAPAAFRQMVGAELGPEAEARFDAAIVRGEPLAPPADAFGPCFKREKRGKGFTWVLSRPRGPQTCVGPARP